MTRDHVAVVVVGAGPCGIGCVRELHRLGAASPDRVLVLEAADHPGGLGASVVDQAGAGDWLGWITRREAFGGFGSLETVELVAGNGW